MELAIVFLVVILGVGAIVYAGMRSPKKPTSDTGGGDAPVMPMRDTNADQMDGGGSDGDGDGGD